MFVYECILLHTSSVVFQICATANFAVLKERTRYQLFKQKKEGLGEYTEIYKTICGLVNWSI